MAPRQRDAVEWSRWFQLQCIMGRWGEKIPYLVILFTYNAFFKAANKNALLVLQIAGLWQFCSIKTCRPNGIKCMQLARSTRLASVRDVLSFFDKATLTVIFPSSISMPCNYMSMSAVCDGNTSKVPCSKGNKPRRKNLSIPFIIRPCLTHDRTLRMVCGCLANAIGSSVDPVRPAPKDPTPSIFSHSLSRSSQHHARGSTAGWASTVGTGSPARAPCALHG